MVGRLEAAQKLANHEARSTMGAFRTTNQGALSLESGLKSAATQLDNRLRRFALRLASLPKGDQTRELVGASDSALGQRLQSALGCWSGREETVLLEVASPLDATTTIEEEAAAAKEASQLVRPGSSRTDPAWRTERPATRSYGRKARNGKATKPTLAGAKKPSTPSVPPSRGHCR